MALRLLDPGLYHSIWRLIRRCSHDGPDRAKRSGKLLFANKLLYGAFSRAGGVLAAGTGAFKLGNNVLLSIPASTLVLPAKLGLASDWSGLPFWNTKIDEMK